MPRTVLVTGAYGFVGRYAARRWAREGWRVTGLGHGTWPRPEWRSWGLDDWHTGDVTLDTLVNYGAEPDLIIHCAGSGSVGFSVAHPYQDFQRTVQTMISVLEYARLHSPRANVVLPSSAAVYGTVLSLPIAESAALSPVSPYGVHKRLAEELCLSYAAHFKLRVAIVRLFSIYGIGLRKQLLWDACRKLAAGEASFGGTGDERRDWINIEDAVELLAVAAEHASDQALVLNGGCGTSIRVREVLERVAAGFDVAPALQFTGTTRRGDPDSYEADATKAQALGWRPQVGLHAGIDSYVSWFKAGAA